MARLSELHGLDSSLHRYPLALNTYGEPSALPLLAAGPYRVGQALHIVSA